MDQQNEFSRLIKLDRNSGFVPPGLFHIEIRGVGQIEVSITLVKIAQLRIATLVPKSFDVLGNGPVFRKLAPGIESFNAEVSQRLSEMRLPVDAEWLQSAGTINWISAAGRGKRGGLRVIYYTRLRQGVIWMLTLYPKNVTDSIPGAMIKKIKGEIDA